MTVMDETALPAVTHVGVKEFRDKATQLLAREQPFVIERHGKAIGYYVPIKKKDKRKAREALDRLDETMRRTADEAGMTVAELENLLVGDLP